MRGRPPLPEARQERVCRVLMQLVGEMAASHDPVALAVALEDVGRLAHDLVHDCVAAARRPPFPASWQEVADAFGVSRQAAQKRFDR